MVEESTAESIEIDGDRKRTSNNNRTSNRAATGPVIAILYIRV